MKLPAVVFKAGKRTHNEGMCQMGHKEEQNKNGAGGFDSRNLYDSITYPAGSGSAKKPEPTETDKKMGHLYDSIVYPENQKTDEEINPPRNGRKQPAPTVVLKKSPRIDL